MKEEQRVCAFYVGGDNCDEVSREKIGVHVQVERE